MNKIYTGIGSRNTPIEILNLMTKIATELSNRGYLLRSGGADGADLAFEKGSDNKEIYLPWINFNNNDSPLYLPFSIKECNEKAVELAKKFHPKWDNLSFGAKKMMIRNSHQLFGWKMDIESDFVIAWTKDGKDTGGTGQALRIAKYYDIKIYNLFNDNDIKQLKKLK